MLEVTKWINVVSAGIHIEAEIPIFEIIYALGYAAGNVMGTIIE